MDVIIAEKHAYATIRLGCTALLRLPSLICRFWDKNPPKICESWKCPLNLGSSPSRLPLFIANFKGKNLPKICAKASPQAISFDSQRGKFPRHCTLLLPIAAPGTRCNPGHPRANHSHPPRRLKELGELHDKAWPDARPRPQERPQGSLQRWFEQSHWIETDSIPQPERGHARVPFCKIFLQPFCLSREEFWINRVSGFLQRDFWLVFW